MKKQNKVVLGLCALGLLAGGVGLTSAYFTDNESVTNTFEVGNVTIDLLEPNWDTTDDDADGTPDKAENIVPCKTLEKDPQIKNIGENSAYAYLEVKIPVKNLVTAGTTGTKNTAKDTELFTMVGLSDKWELLNKTTKDADGNAVYVYGYKTAVAPNETTEPLFTSIQFANVIEGQNLEDTTLNVPVKAMAIQSEESGTMQEAYAKYVAQNN